MIKTSSFVKRQTRTSEFSYFKGSWEELEHIVTANYVNNFFKVGYREGVILVDILEQQLHKFYTAIVPSIEVKTFETVVEARREGEDKYTKTIAYGVKKLAQEASIVLYSKDVLAEDPLNELTGAQWEIISINCSPYRNKEVPMVPMTLARNFLQAKGGTKGSYSSEQFAESIMFWNTHSMIREKE